MQVPPTSRKTAHHPSAQPGSGTALSNPYVCPSAACWAISSGLHGASQSATTGASVDVQVCAAVSQVRYVPSTDVLDTVATVGWQSAAVVQASPVLFGWFSRQSENGQP